MDHRAVPEHDLAHRLRAGIDAGDLPTPDLADVQRRADRRARRRTVSTAAVAGASALALVGVLAVAVPAISDVVTERDAASAALADRPQRATGDDARSGGVDDARLEDFTDSRLWSTLPPLRWSSPPPGVPLVTEEDLETAFSGTSRWRGLAIFGQGGDWLGSWCTPDDLVDAQIPDRPGDYVGGGVPASEGNSRWGGAVGADPDLVQVDVDVLRWGDRDAVDDAGVDRVALDAADVWGAAIAGDATACPGATTLDPSSLPGEHATLSVMEMKAPGTYVLEGSDQDEPSTMPAPSSSQSGGLWQVQAVTVGGPTAVRVRATFYVAPDASTAGDRAVAMVRRVVANTVRADALEQGRPDPGPLP